MYLPEHKIIVVVINDHRSSSVWIEVRERRFLHREHVKQDTYHIPVRALRGLWLLLMDLGRSQMLNWEVSCS